MIWTLIEIKSSPNAGGDRGALIPIYQHIYRLRLLPSRQMLFGRFPPFICHNLSYLKFAPRLSSTSCYSKTSLTFKEPFLPAALMHKVLFASVRNDYTQPTTKGSLHGDFIRQVMSFIPHFENRGHS
jgi:hypothetical protein